MPLLLGKLLTFPSSLPGYTLPYSSHKHILPLITTWYITLLLSNEIILFLHVRTSHKHLAMSTHKEHFPTSHSHPKYHFDGFIWLQRRVISGTNGYLTSIRQMKSYCSCQRYKSLYLWTRVISIQLCFHRDHQQWLWGHSFFALK